MTATITEKITLETCTCYKCGVVFAFPEYLMKTLKESGARFYCPSGHAQVYGKSEVDRLREQLDKQKKRTRQWMDAHDQECDRHESTKRSLSATKGQVTKIKKRVGRGVCPCCNRHFVNLERHMASKHPDYHDSECGAEILDDGSP